MTVMIDIKEQYLDKLEKFIDSLPNDAVVVKSSLTEELDKRVGEYKTGKMEILPFDKNLSTIREKLIAKI